MANSGAAVELKAVDFTPEISVNFDDSPAIGTFDSAEVVSAGFNNLKFVIKGTLDRTDTTDQSLLIHLIKLCKTRGWKAIYYNSASENYAQQLVYMLAEDTASGDLATIMGAAYKYIKVIVTGFSITHSSKSQMNYTLEMIETA